MARNRTRAQKSAAKNKARQLGILCLPHQRRLPLEYRTIFYELLEVEEGRIEERAPVLPFQLGVWPTETMTAKIMRHVENFKLASRLTPFAELPVH